MTNVVVTDKVPAGLTLIEESLANNATYVNGVITWDVGTLLPGQNITLTFTCSIINLDQIGEFINQASMDFDQNSLNTPIDSNEVEAIGDDEVHGSDVEPEIQIVKNQSVNNGAMSENYLQVTKGDKITYYLTVTNTGATAAKNVVINDPIPAGLTIVEGSISNDGQVNSEGNMIVWTIPTLAAGESVQVQVTFNIPLTSTENRFENTAYVNYEDNEQGNIGSNNVESGTQSPVTPGTNSNTVTQRVPQTGSSSTSTPVSSVSSSSPKTGVDNTFIILWIIVFGCALAVLGYQIYRQLKE